LASCSYESRDLQAAPFSCSSWWMHRARGGRLAPSLIPYSHPPSSVSRHLRKRSTSSSKNATKTTERTWISSARGLLKIARPSRTRPPIFPKSQRTTEIRSSELRLVHSILEESGLPTATERAPQDVVPPEALDLDGYTSELPPGVGPGALVEVRL
jgi:hypothetical protein